MNHAGPVNFFSCFKASIFPCRPEDDDFNLEEELQKLHPQRPLRKPEFEPRSRRGMIGDDRVSVIPEGGGPGEDSEEDSDSDGPILYREDNDDDEDDEEGPPSKSVFLIHVSEVVEKQVLW